MEYQFFWLLLCFLSYGSASIFGPVPTTYEVSFALPTDQSNVYVNSNIIVNINTTPTSTLNPSALTLNMDCGGSVSTFDNFILGSNQQVPPPTNFTGTCLLYTLQTSNYYASNPNVTVNVIKGTVTFSSPQGIQNVLAGSSLQLNLTSVPTSANFNVTLDCNNPLLTPVTNITASNTNRGQFFYFPSNYYGVNCTMNVTSPLNLFTPTNNLIVNVQQPVSVISNVGASPFNGVIPLQLRASVQLDSLLTLVQTCGSNTTYYPNNLVNTTINATPPFNYIGNCLFSSLANGSYSASTSNWTIIVASTYQITLPANNSFVNSNSVLTVSISTQPQSFTSQTLDVSLYCYQAQENTYRTAKIVTNTNDTQLYYVPSNFYGKCSLFVDDWTYVGSEIILTVTQPIWFLQPLAQSLYLVNSIVPVTLNSSYVNGDTLTLFQNCNGNVRNYTNISVRQTVNATVPTDFIGYCTFSTSANGTYLSAGSISINIVPTNQVQFASPGNLSSFPAGTNIAVRLFSSIFISNQQSSLSANFNVQLNCNNPGTSSIVQVISSNTAGSVAFPVPSNFYGTNCTLSIIDSTTFTPTNPLSISVTQAPSIVNPLRSLSFLIGSPVPFLISSTGPYPQSVFTVVRNCSNSIVTYNNVLFDLTLETTLPTNYTGPCSFSTLPTGIYRSAVLPFYIVNGSVTIIEPFNGASINAGTSFRIRLSSSLYSVNATVQLDCSIPGVAPLVVNIISNSGAWQGMSVPSTYYGTNCTLNITSLPENFFASNSLNITITQPVTIVSPSNSLTLMTNSVVPVLLTSPLNSTLPFTLVQNCSNIITNFTGLTLNNFFNATLPVGYSGPCTFTTAPSDYYLASLPVNVLIVSTPVVVFLQPLNQTTFVNGARVGIVLTSTSNAANFTVQLNCGIPGIWPANATIASNAQVTPQFNVPSNFYGNCMFSIVNVTSPFTSINTVNNTVTQPVNFAQPLNGAIFNVNEPVPVLLASPVVTSTTVNVTQNCNGTVRTYSNVNINVTFIATLPTDYLGSCVFGSTANGMYRSAPSVTISTVSSPRVRFASPANMTYVNAGSAVGVRLLSTSSAAVFSVQLNCGISGIPPVVTDVTSNLATNTALNVPSTFYGMNCSLSIINSGDFNVLNNLTIVVTQGTFFTLPVRSGTYLTNDEVPMSLSSPINSSTSFNVTQNCNGTLATFSNVTLGTTYQTPLPTNFVGACRYISQAVDFYRSASVTIYVVQGTVSFTAPANGTVVGSGTNVVVRLYSNIKSANFTVQLDCSMQSYSPVTYTVLSNTNVNVEVPLDFYGEDYCIFSVINPPPSFQPQNTARIIVPI